MSAPAAATAEAIEALTVQLLQEHPPADTPYAELLGAQFDAGLAWVYFPVGRGGLGAEPHHQRVVDRLLAEAGFTRNPLRNPFALSMAAPTLLAHADPELLDRLLRPMFTDEHIWCQLFSEPGAGSDLAGLAARAERDGDEWVVNGQKVWTSLAHKARWGMLVARTDPNAPKHRGITYFALDMHTPGVEVRPLRQITGDAEFNEVYLTDVRVPDRDRVGDVDAGWPVLLTTLMNERVALGGGVPTRGTGPIHQALGLWTGLADKPPAVRDRLVRLWVRAEVGRLANTRGAALAAAGSGTPLYGALGKIAGAELNQEIYALCMELLGAAGTLFDSYEMRQPDQFMIGSDDPAVAFLRSQGQSLEGGTSDVMRNIVGERILGLPGEPRSDKDVPWRSVPRN